MSRTLALVIRAARYGCTDWFRSASGLIRKVTREFASLLFRPFAHKNWNHELISPAFLDHPEGWQDAQDNHETGVGIGQTWDFATILPILI
jgi:hypothetical protein